MKITCTGSVRGNCGKTHRSIGAALSCIERDASGCGSQGGYSDRRPVGVDEEGDVEVGRYDNGDYEDGE